MRKLTHASAVLLLLTSPVGHALDCGTAAPDPSRIAVAGGSITEILYALGEQQRIVAVDSTSTFPATASVHPQIGYVRNLSTEGLLSLQPSLVLGEHDMGPPAVLDQLQILGVDVLRVPERFDAAGIIDKIRCVASAIDAGTAAAGLIERLERQAARLGNVAARQGQQPRGVVLLAIQEGAPLAAGRNTSGHGLLRMAGAANVMADVEDWKPVSSEAMAQARPDFIVIPERGLQAAGGMDQLLGHPALRLTPAAAARRVVTMDGMAMLGFGPRTLDAALRLREALQPAAGES